MTTAATTLLGLALPVTGELSGTWGDTVNNSITNLLDTAVAGTTTLSTDGDVILTTTTLASNQARQAILLCTGARTAARNITAPAQSKIYTVINATTGGYSVVIRGVGPTTGVTVPAGRTMQVAWNGSDFVDASTSFAATGVANAIVYLDASKVPSTTSSFTWNGTNNFNITTNTESGATAPLISTVNSNSGTTQLKIFHSGSDLGIYNAREALILGSKNTFDAQVYNGAISIGDTAMTGNRLSLVRSTEQAVGAVQIFKNLYRSGGVSARQMGLLSFGSWRDISTSGSYCSAIEGYQSGDSGTYGQLRFYTNDNGSNDPQYPVTSGRRNLVLFPDGATFNDAALDIDFTIASDTNSTAFFLDAGNSRIGINNNAPTEALTVSGNIKSTSSVFGATSVYVTTGNGTVQMRDVGGTSGNNAVELQVRPNSGKQGWLTFAESGVADRWAVGIVNADSSLYFKSNQFNSATQQIFRSTGGAIFNVSQNDSDFAVRTQASAYGLQVDTSANRVGINQETPAGRFEVNQNEAIPGIWIRDDRTGGRPTLTFYNREIAGPAITGQILFGGFRDVRNPSYAAAILGYNYSSGFGNTGRITINVGSNGEDSISSLPAAVVTVDTGGVTITGSLSKSSGSFRIDHPLPALTETHDLVHSFVEAPQADNLYRGKVALVNGTATVNIDQVAGMTEGTFVLLNREVQCFTTNESDWVHVRGSVSGNILTIEAQDPTATSLISWMVMGERQDKHMFDTDWTDDNGKVIVEPVKKPIPDIPEAPAQ